MSRSMMVILKTILGLGNQMTETMDDSRIGFQMNKTEI